MMIKTLKITSFLFALLAMAIISIPALSRADDGSSDNSKYQSIIEKFKESNKSDAQAQQGEPPLVTQAKKFALYLDPPAPKNVQRPTPKPAKAQPVAPPPRPQQVRSRYPVMGTCYNSFDPNQSLALIDYPADGPRWTKQGSKVGHLVLKEVREKTVVFEDGSRTFEEQIEETKSDGDDLVSAIIYPDGTREVLSASTSNPSQTIQVDNSQEQSQTLSARSSGVMQRNTSRSNPNPQPPVTNEQADEQFQKVLEQIQQMQRGSSGSSSQADEEKIFEALNEAMGSRISNKESQEIEEMGENLDSNSQETPPAGRSRRPTSRRR